MKSHQLLIPILLLCAFFTSCKDDEIQSTPKTGTITGQLKLHDEFGNALATNSNVLITATTGEKGVSNTTGIYQITELATDIYNLTYTKNGIGTYKKFNIQVTSGSATNLNGIDNLGEKSTTEISNLTEFFNTQDSTYTFGCTLSPTPDATNKRGFRLFFDKTNDVNQSNHLFTPNNAWISTVASGVITGFQRSNLYGSGFAKGDSVYVVAIGEAFITNTYTDPVSHKKIYPNVNSSAPSNVVGFILE
jgi:hypothetical protein